MLHRSKQRPLTLMVDQNAIGTMFVLRNHPERVGAIEVSAHQNVLKYLFALTGMKSPAPRLRSLKITNTPPSRTHGDHEGPDFGFWLNEDMFHRADSLAGGSGRGARLHLECCAFPWTSPWYSHLSHLHLQRLSGEYRLAMEDLFAILHRSPKLETLVLIDVGLEGETTEALELCDLRELRLRAPRSSCTHLMQHLTFPVMALVEITALASTLPFL